MKPLGAGKLPSLSSETVSGESDVAVHIDNYLWKPYVIRMKTTIDIPESLLSAVQIASKARTKKEAVTVALEEYVRLRRSEELASLLGTFDDFMDRKELDALRGNS